jgi:membrane dipeptidase
LPEGLGDCSQMPEITKELVKRGYSEKDIKKILGGNFMRVFKKVCKR